MNYKIEKSGCCERKGLLQIRMDIDKGDTIEKGKILPKEGYTGKLIEGQPADMEDYQKWYDSLPIGDVVKHHIHSHLFFLDHDATDEDIKTYADKMYQKYKNGEPMENDEIVWKPENKSLCEARIASVKTTDFTKITAIK